MKRIIKKELEIPLVNMASEGRGLDRKGQFLGRSRIPKDN